MEIELIVRNVLSNSGAMQRMRISKIKDLIKTQPDELINIIDKMVEETDPIKNPLAGCSNCANCEPKIKGGNPAFYCNFKMFNVRPDSSCIDFESTK